MLLGTTNSTYATDSTSISNIDTTGKIFNLSLDELMNLKITTASKKEELVSESPSIVSAISREEIEKMAVTSLIDVLKFIPGVEVSMGPNGHYRLAIRGVRKDGNILMLIDGHHINDFYNGRAIYDFPTAFIEQVEVIRGPGSALFGTNAVSGVINIITRSPGNNNMEFLTGNNSSYSSSVNYSKNLSESTLFSFSTGYWNTEGANTEPRSDLHEMENWVNYSIPVGELSSNRWRKDFFLNTRFKHKNLNFSLFNISRQQGSWVGPLNELATNSHFLNHQMIADLSYKLELTEKLTITPKIYSDYVNHNYLLQERPEGFVGKTGQTFTDGMFTHNVYQNQTLGGEVQINFDPTDKINLIGGSVLEYLSLNQFDIERNYSIPQELYYGDSLGLNSVQGHQGFANHDQVQLSQRGQNRSILASFVQGNISGKAYSLTVGGRFDSYSDFGSTINPRLGLVLKPNDWIKKKFMEGFYLKVLFGSAFRAPTFKELYDQTSIASSAIYGNSSLRPERVRSREIAIEYRKKEYQIRFNLFSNNSFDIIEGYDPAGSGSIARFENVGSTSSSGFEIEAALRLYKRFNIKSNYSIFQRKFLWDQNLTTVSIYNFLIENPNNQWLTNSPLNRLNLSLDYTTNKIQIFTGFNYGSQARANKRSQIEASRITKIPPYLQGNASIRYKFGTQFSLQASINNVGLRVPTINGDLFSETSGSTKYTDPHSDTNIWALGSGGMAQPLSTILLKAQLNF